MTFGQFALAISVALMLVQFAIIAKTSGVNGASRGMVLLMFFMAVFLPIFSYLAFFQFWPELGAKTMVGAG